VSAVSKGVASRIGDRRCGQHVKAGPSDD
jgi:hypothetical protein